MDFLPLQASTRGNGPVLDAEVQQLQLCSPRSVYFLATAVGIPIDILLLALTY